MATKGCVRDLSSIIIDDNISRPLDHLLQLPVCADVTLEAQAQMIDRAMCADVLSLTEFAGRVSIAFAVWFSVEQLARVYIARRWSSLGPSSAATAVEVRQCIVSCTHALWSVAATIFLASRITQPYGAHEALRHIPHRDINPVGTSFFAYLLWDLSHILSNRHVHAKIVGENLLHHGCFMAMMLANQKVLWFNYAFPVLYIGELSTFFLSLRVCYRKMNVPELWVSACFALTFALTRVVVMGLLVAHLVASWGSVRTLLSAPLQLSYLGGLPAMYALNLFWFSKIVDAVRRTLKGKAE